jgi:hypothetical protein
MTFRVPHTSSLPKRFACVSVVVALVVPFGVSTAWGIPPAAKEYSLQFPNAKGHTQPGTDSPHAIPSELSPGVRKALKSSPNGEALAAIATASDLGAPGAGPGLGGLGGSSVDLGNESTPSLVGALGDTLADPAVILLLLTLGLGVLAAFKLRPRSPSPGP